MKMIRQISFTLIAVLLAFMAYSATQETGTGANKTSPVASTTKPTDPSKIPDDEFFVTDISWEKGIARRFPGFFVRNTPENREAFSVGNTVILTNGEKRTVAAAIQKNIYLNVEVSGDILKSSKVGLPSKFKTLPAIKDKKSQAVEKNKEATTTNKKAAQKPTPSKK